MTTRFNCNDSTPLTSTVQSLFVESLQASLSPGRCQGWNALNCPRSNDRHCDSLLRDDYRFYLSFENSNCRDYITEKFFHNALQSVALSHINSQYFSRRNRVVPIVMGAPKSDVTRVAPPHSFIHIDDFASPRELGAYLKYLSINTTAYKEYFAWATSGMFCCTVNTIATVLTFFSQTLSQVFTAVFRQKRGVEFVLCSTNRGRRSTPISTLGTKFT